MRRLPIAMRVSPPCPFPGCQLYAEPVFCESHWPKLSGEMRGKLMDELNVLKARGQHTPTPALHALFKDAIAELKAGA